MQLADIKKGFEHAGNLKFINYMLVLFLLMHFVEWGADAFSSLFILDVAT